MTKRIIIIVLIILLSPSIVALVLFGIDKRNDLSVSEVSPVKSKIVEVKSDLVGVDWHDYYERDDEIKISIDNYSFLKGYGFRGAQYKGIKNLLSVKKSTKSGLMMVATSSMVNTTNDNPSLYSPVAPGGLVLFSEDKSFIRVLPFPHKPFGTPMSYEWLGDGNIFVSYYVKEGKDRGNYYYYVNLSSDSIDFRPVKVNGNLSTNEVTALSSLAFGGKLLPNRHSSLFASSYCLKMEGINSICTRRGVSVSRGVDFEEVMVKNTKNDINIGWKGDDLYILEEGKFGEKDVVYVVDTDTLSLAFPSTSVVFTEPARDEKGIIKGDSVWTKIELPVEETFNAMSLEVELTGGKDSKGLFRMYLDGNLIGVLYEEQIEKEKNEYTFIFSDQQKGMHELEFRLDPLNKRVRSDISFGSARTGYVK